MGFRTGMHRRTLLKSAAAMMPAAMVNSSPASTSSSPSAKKVLFVFLTGGISQHDTFDMKPDAGDDIRGTFQPVSTKTPGTQICEYLPKLGARSEAYTLVRSMKTDSSGHEPACHMMLTGRRDLPIGFSLKKVPSPNEWPTIASVVTYAMRNRRDLRMPAGIILPQPSVNEVGKVRPGQYAGQMGKKYEAWHINIAGNCALGNGPCPDCFRFEGTPFDCTAPAIFSTPSLNLPPGGADRFDKRVGLLDFIQNQQRGLNSTAAKLDAQRQQAYAVLSDPTIRSAFNVEQSDPKLLQRYGKNKFGLSCLMAKRLLEGGATYVQVNLGKNSSWDTHRRNFANLKENLLPPFDLCISALLDDMQSSGLLDDTLVIVGGEFGRTPKINKDAGRDHWGPASTMMFAGAGIQGGRVIGATDRNGVEVTEDMVMPENFSATIYDALGIPKDTRWVGTDGRPHDIYHGSRIEQLYS
ncbi:MAG: DUF1501 domain-containing protein [Planctomycetota bacterium]|nr:DUF1501 domain-containing protein [Planctomycetota bacterium]